MGEGARARGEGKPILGEAHKFSEALNGSLAVGVIRKFGGLEQSQVSCTPVHSYSRAPSILITAKPNTFITATRVAPQRPILCVLIGAGNTKIRLLIVQGVMTVSMICQSLIAKG